MKENNTFDYFGTQGSVGLTFDPLNFTIEAGCLYIDHQTWKYSWQDHSGMYIVVFTSEFIPAIGDKVINNVLVKADLPISNQDHSKWIQSEDQTWPSRTRHQ